ncbi:mitogen-activated protein kinase kinase kinase 17-like [Phragmites australis]|uniref:mitogen-activated protein kinase kinase kinase 17-like n=1 Tax=Phragmites australis TaxID=29695 RepID=UPI002D786352|nr:mitogen-activated protein kinase kinase kinase 17-like [Phragmites australis]
MEMDAGISGRRLTRLRTLGRGASGAAVSLFSAGEELLAVKSAGGAAGAEQLRREGGIMASLCSPHVLRCIGFRAAAGGECQLLLEFAPGGSLADEVERNGGRLEEAAVRAYAADVARGIAYLHGESIVHGDVKGRNVVIGADGRAKLADFGCARCVGSKGPIGGTPAFMAPEVARWEEQGPAADVWALGCTVIEMATGRAPWSDMDDVVAAVRMIGYTDAVPEAPEWLSAEAKDFLDKCLRRDASERWTAAQLLEYQFLASAGCGVNAEDTKAKWVSPKSTLDAALWESDADDEDDEQPESAADRIRALAGPCSALPDWESDEGWIEVCSLRSELPDAAAAAQEVKFPTHGEISDAAVATSSEQMHSDVSDLPMAATAVETMHYAIFWGDESEAEAKAEVFGADLDAGDDPRHNVGAADAYAHQQQQYIHANFTSDRIVLHLDISDEEIVKTLSVVKSPLFLFLLLLSSFSLLFY